MENRYRYSYSDVFSIVAVTSIIIVFGLVIYSITMQSIKTAYFADGTVVVSGVGATEGTRVELSDTNASSLVYLLGKTRYWVNKDPETFGTLYKKVSFTLDEKTVDFDVYKNGKTYTMIGDGSGVLRGISKSYYASKVLKISGVTGSDFRGILKNESEE